MSAHPIPTMTDGQTERFWAKVDKTSGECWLWTACLVGGGYGSFTIGRAKRKAHRIAYVLTHGEPPAGLDLDHLCRVRHCVNPAHLEPVTRVVNLRRGVGHGSETHCPRGHTYADAYRVQGGTARQCRTCCLERGRENYRNKVRA